MKDLKQTLLRVTNSMQRNFSHVGDQTLYLPLGFFFSICPPRFISFSSLIFTLDYKPQCRVWLFFIFSYCTVPCIFKAAYQMVALVFVILILANTNWSGNWIDAGSLLDVVMSSDFILKHRLGYHIGIFHLGLGTFASSSPSHCFSGCIPACLALPCYRNSISFSSLL